MKDKGIRVFVDDCRKAMPGWILVKNYKTTITVLENFKIDILSLDHDLGENKTGYDIICWIEEKCATDPDFIPPGEILCHSSNPVGREKIELVAERIKK